LAVCLAGIVVPVFAQNARPEPPTIRVEFLNAATGITGEHYGVPVSFEYGSSYDYAGELREWPPPKF
jgi:hypothetical protein